MIKAVFYEYENGTYKGFTVEGHAGFAVSGKDVVCAAVSMLVINTINSIESFTADKFRVEDDEEKGIIDFEFISDQISPDSALLLDSMVLGLNGVRKEYGKFIEIRV